mgnify:CR=1 FL=1
MILLLLPLGGALRHVSCRVGLVGGADGEALLGWLKQGVKDGTIRALPAETYASLLIGQAENYCKAWLSGRVKGSPLDYADTFTDAAWRSVGVY